MLNSYSLTVCLLFGTEQILYEALAQFTMRMNQKSNVVGQTAKQ